VPTPGGTLTCAPGGWSGVISFSYLWLRDAAGIVASSSYTPSPADLGHLVSCVVTARNSDGSTTATSAAVRVSDTAPPVVRALRSTGRRAHKMRLNYWVRDNSGVTRDTITVYRRSGRIRRIPTGFGESHWAQPYYVA